MSRRNKGFPVARVRQPADTTRITAILNGPVSHDPLYAPFYDEDGEFQQPVLEQRNPHKMPRNVAPLVCPIKKGD